MGRHIYYQCKLVTCHLGHGDMGDEGVELVGGVLILVPQPGEAHAHPEGGAAHPLRPDGLVQPGVNAHVRCAHLLLSKLFNLLKKKHATQKQTYNTHSHIYVSFNSLT